MVLAFLSYYHDNKNQVAKLREAILAAGINVWWDGDILPGRNYRAAFGNTLAQADRVIICFSQETQHRSQTILLQVRDVVEMLRDRIPGNCFLIPVRLSDCEIPAFEIDAVTTLRHLIHVDLFPPEQWDAGLQLLLKAIEEGLSAPNSTTQSHVSPASDIAHVVVPMSVDGANISTNETRIPGAYLVKFPGGTRYALGSRLTIGRAYYADIRLVSHSVARLHAQIEQPKPDQFELTDLRTRNGTYLNGTQIQTPCRLRNGDLIRICDYSFQFVLNSSAPGPISEKSSDGQQN